MQKLPKLIPQVLTGDLRRGGWTVTGYVDGDTNAVTDGQNWQLQGRSGCGFLDAGYRTYFDGHLIAQPDNLRFDRYTSRAQIQAGTMQELLMGVDLQDIGFTSQAMPLNDHQITNMDLASIVDHILRRHNNSVFNATTMPDGVVTDLDVDLTNSVPLQRYNVSKSDNLWRSLQSIGGGEEAGEFYRPWFSRKNKFYYQPAPAFWAVPPTSKGTITKDHLRGQVRVKVNANQPGEKIGQVSITAVKDFSTVYTASYPANPADGKILRPKDGIFADSQAKANTLAQRLYQWLTRAYTLIVEVDPALVLFGDDGDGLDLADKISLTYDGPAEDTATGAGVHLDFNLQSFFVYGVSVRSDVYGKMATAFLTLEQDPT